MQLQTPAVEEGVKRRQKERQASRRNMVAKAASISRLLLALRTWICSPMARAADPRFSETTWSLRLQHWLY